MSDPFADLDDDLDTPAPLFPVEAPDGRKDLSELERQAWFVTWMKRNQPQIEVFANANAAKRGFKAQAQAKKEGLKAGVFDLTVGWDYRDSRNPQHPISVAWPEFKGYDAAGRPGRLSDAQIRWGNAMHERGFPVACFFSGKSVIAWLRELGAPLREVRS